VKGVQREKGRGVKMLEVGGGVRKRKLVVQRGGQDMGGRLKDAVPLRRTNCERKIRCHEGNNPNKTRKKNRGTSKWEVNEGETEEKRS